MYVWATLVLLIVRINMWIACYARCLPEHLCRDNVVKRHNSKP